jgi:hypothetical protein
MDNHDRRVAYLMQNLGISRPAADRQAMTGYALGTQDRHLTPAQRRRIRHKRGALHEPAPRGPQPRQEAPDEAAPAPPPEISAEQAMRSGWTRMLRVLPPVKRTRIGRI